MIVITPETLVHKEIDIISELFKEGLDVLHVRKPGISQDELAAYLQSIDEMYRSQICLHQWLSLAESFGINRFHYKDGAQSSRQKKNSATILSASTHSMDTFNKLPNEFGYAFLSPVFESISKVGYKPKVNMGKALEQRSNFKTRLVALGGVDSENIAYLLESGYDEVALSGAIWNSSEPIKKFIQCMNFVQ